MRAAFLVLVATFLILPASVEAHGRKLFLDGITTGENCLGITERALLTRIAPEIPRDVLERQELQYAERPSVAGIANWNPSASPSAVAAQLTMILQDLDVRYVLSFDLSCLPSDGHARYMLTARLTDVDGMNTVLNCPHSQAAQVQGRRVCNINGSVFDTTSFASTNMRTFDEFARAVRRLVARVLHVPELSLANAAGPLNPAEDVDSAFDPPEHVILPFDPSEDINLAFLARRNEGRNEPEFAGMSAPERTYHLRQDVVQIPGDLFDDVCRQPETRWDAIACSSRGFTDRPCDRADRVRFAVHSLIHGQIDAVASARLDGDRGGDRIVFRAPPHEEFYLLRAQIVADEPGRSLASTPLFACLHVRSRRTYVGVTVRLGTPLAEPGADYSSAIYPGVSFNALAWGVDVPWTTYLASSRARFFPNSYLGLLSGISYLAGTYPCQAGTPPECPGSPSAPSRPAHFSQSWTLSLRLQARAELFRVGRFAPIVVSHLGIGAELLTSQVPFRNDGWGAVFLSGGGVGLQFGVGRAGGLFTQYWLTAEMEARMRLSGRVSTATLRGGQAWVDAGGVPDTSLTLWFVFGGVIATSSSPR